MGIPGLSTKLARYRKAKSKSFFEGGIFYVDGLNLFHDVGVQADKKMSARNSKDDLICAIVERELALLRKLLPKSIYIFFDAYFPLEKIPIKIARRQAKLQSQSGAGMTGYVASYLIKKDYDDIKIIFSGLEGETAIAQHIHETQSQDPNIKRFIFSDDSDVFTYNFPLKKLVFAVPLRNNRASKDVDVIPVASAWPLIEHSQRIELPISPICESVVNPKVICSDLLQMTNLVAYENTFCRFFPSVLIPNISTLPFIAQRYSRVCYASILDQYFHDRDMEIDVYQENDFQFELVKESKASPELVKEIITGLETLPLPTLVYNEFKHFQAEIRFTDDEIYSIYLFLRDFLHDKCKIGKCPSPRTTQAQALIDCLLREIGRLINITSIPRELGNLHKPINEFQLCAYIA